MLNRTFAKGLLMTVVVSLSLVLSYSNAFAREAKGASARGRDSRVENRRGHNTGYSYHGNRWYRRGWFGIEIVVPFPPIGVIVADIPAGHSTIIVDGAPYYHYNHVYYRPCPAGYIVVQAPPAPQLQSAAQLPAQDYLTINVPNSNGSYTPVTLVKTDSGYTGPQGEFYLSHPTVDQLKVLYGK